MSAEGTRDGRNWAIVLAAGEGSRLRELTTHEGRHTPKQYCSLRGGRSLLGDALERAAALVGRKRVVVVVAEEHRLFWEHELALLPLENVVVQPRNRGTAAGVLLPLLVVLERDPQGRVAILPSDHSIENEPVLGRSLRIGFDSLSDLGEGTTLFGITPKAPETGLGWIVPARSERLVRPVDRFVEKPDSRQAAELRAQGGVWNSFLMIGSGFSLLRLFEAHVAPLLVALRSALAARGDRANRLATLYEELETQDFSRDVLQRSPHHLRVIMVPPCGWTDLGTPSRVVSCLSSVGHKNRSSPAGTPTTPGHGLDLSRVVACLEAAGKLNPMLA